MLSVYLYSFVIGGLVSFVLYLIVQLFLSADTHKPYVSATITTMIFFLVLMAMSMAGVLMNGGYFPADRNVYELLCMLLIPLALNIPYTLVRQRRSTLLFVGIPFVAYMLMLVGYLVYRDDKVVMLALGLTVAYAATFAMWFIMSVRQFQRQVSNVYSSLDNVGLVWFAQLFFVFVSWGCFFALSVVLKGVYVNLIYYLGCFAIWAYLYHFVKYQQPVDLKLLDEAMPANPRLNLLFDEEDMQFLEASDSDSSSDMVESEQRVYSDDEIFAALDYCMAKEQMFLKSDLTIREIKEKSDIPMRQLIGFITEKLGKCFADYVVDFRVEYAKKLIEKDPHITQGELARCSGFLTERNLRQSFKNRVGVSLASYIDRLN